MKKSQTEFTWPYPIKWGEEQRVDTDILILGGGIAGCWAAIAAAKNKGVSVTLVEKARTIRSGAGGSGCDHWEHAVTNPSCPLTPEEITHAQIDSNDGYNNGISHYIEAREGYDRLLDLEKMGGKIRDTEDEFKGADFRDEESKFLFAYDYVNKYTIRTWGTTFKPALHQECQRLKVGILDRTMITGLLTESGKPRGRVVGAVGFHVHTGRFVIIRAKATVLCTSRPSRLWLFTPDLAGISEFRPMQACGDGHAISWRIGAEFTMLEKSVQAEWSGARSFPPYGTGNTHNTWYPCNMVDANGREIPWVDRDGNILETFGDRCRPAPGQKFFLKGGGETWFQKYEYVGPDIVSTEELIKQGYKLPFYADLSSLPEMERKAIWGLMIGQESKTKIPVKKMYEDAGFDPSKDLLRSYGDSWWSAKFKPSERQFFGLPGGLMNDWELRTNLEGLYAAGDTLFASDCHGHAAATGYYAGRHAVRYAMSASDPVVEEDQVKKEREATYAPAKRDKGVEWKDLNVSITKIMQEYCGEEKSDDLLTRGLKALNDLWEEDGMNIFARNPHELMRALEVLNIMTNAEIVIHSSIARKASCKQLHFMRSDSKKLDPPEWHKFVIVSKNSEGVHVSELPIDYYSPMDKNYEKYNQEYIKENSA